MYLGPGVQADISSRAILPSGRAEKGAYGVKTCSLTTVSRAAYTRIFGQASKTDKRDAKTIA